MGKSKINTFVIGVTRIGYGFTDIEVDAKSRKDAEKIALDVAGDHTYSEKDADYVLTNSVGVANENDRMSQYLSKMDFKLLKEQKSALYKMQVKMEKGQKLNQKDWDVLEGMINLCNSIQDIAVDEYGYSEKKVFKISRKDK